MLPAGAAVEVGLVALVRLGKQGELGYWDVCMSELGEVSSKPSSEDAAPPTAKHFAANLLDIQLPLHGISDGFLESMRCAHTHPALLLVVPQLELEDARRKPLGLALGVLWCHGGKDEDPFANRRHELAVDRDRCAQHSLEYGCVGGTHAR
jgi:hypothetical protein